MSSRRPTLFHYPTIGSTNDEALRLVATHRPPYFVTAALQTAGRGRHGRVWQSPVGNLYCTAALEPQIPLGQLPLFTLYVALSLCHALTKRTKLKIWLKWPNDLWIGKRKLCGLLAESPITADGRRLLLLGVGLNVNTEKLPAELAATATSLRRETRREWPLLGLQTILTETITRAYTRFAAGRYEKELYLLWNRYDRLVGRTIAYDEAGLTERGRVVGLAPDGSLCVKSGRKVLLLRSGEVSLSRHLR